MANVIAALTMSVDGFIPLPDDSVGHPHVIQGTRVTHLRFRIRRPTEG